MREGQLIFQRAGQLFMAPLDLDSGTLTASPVPLLEDADPEHLAIARDGTAVFMHFPEGGGQRVVRVDRQGVPETLADGSANYRWLRLAPDGTRFTTGYNLSNDKSEIWVVELASQRSWQLADPAPDNTEPVWSPDGTMVVHSSERDGVYDLYWQAADGSGEPTVLSALPFNQWPSSFSPDGDLFMFYGGQPSREAAGLTAGYGVGNGTDIWITPIDGSTEPAIIIGGEGSQRSARFSPDGRYIAYASDESGPWEIYVQPYPALDRRWVVSSSGGTDPVWAADGSELFFRDGTRMLSAAITLTPEFAVGSETLLFESLMWSDPYGDQSYDVFPDGLSFAMFQGDPAGEPRLRVLTGLAELLPR